MTSRPTPITALPGLDAEPARIAEHLRASVVAIRGRAGAGSGTAWPGGLVITNDHVVRGERLRVQLAGGAVAPARGMARDAGRDLAALRVERAPGPAAARTRPAAGLRAGELAIAAGHPWGGNGDATLGIVHRAPRLDPGTGAPAEHVQADARLAPGSSGGPLADAAGRVVGINSMIAYGVAVAIPTETVEAFVRGIDAGAGAQGELGIAVMAVPLTDVPVAGGAAQGLLVTGVAAGSAAEAAGIIPGDIVIGVDGAALGLDPLVARLRSLPAGRATRLHVLRGGERRTLDVIATAATAA